MKTNVTNRVYSLVNKNGIHNRREHFTYGWSSYPSGVVDYFDEQQMLPENKRRVEKGDYVVLFHDRDSGAFGYSKEGNDGLLRMP